MCRAARVGRNAMNDAIETSLHPVTVIVTGSGAIYLPDDVRSALRIEPGDELAIELRRGTIVLTPQPHVYVRRIRGLYSEVWRGFDVDEYIDREREAWESPSVTAESSQH
jgi:AbrB family looped-hinge helix DNA binding protein